MSTHVYHTVNCGLYFLNHDTGIFFDGIHRGRELGYSDTTPDVLDRCENKKEPFENLQALIFTHRHSDHFIRSDVEQIAGKNNLQVYAPEYDHNTVQGQILGSDVSFFSIGPFDIYAIRTIHDGNATLRAAPHVSFVVNTDSETFFVAGDALFRQGEAEKVEHYCDNWIDAAFVNPYQMMLGANRNFLRSLDPKKVVQVHKPYPEDDLYNIYPVFDTAEKKYPADMPELILSGFDRWIF